MEKQSLRILATKLQFTRESKENMHNWHGTSKSLAGFCKEFYFYFINEFVNKAFI